jgi:hypothetical protein
MPALAFALQSPVSEMIQGTRGALLAVRGQERSACAVHE